jgi:hypothetical protein
MSKSVKKRDAVLIIVGDATETVDTLYPILRLKEEGITPVVAGPEKRRYNMVLHERPQHGWDITREFEGYTIEADIAFRDVVEDEYLGIFFSGCRAPEYIRDDLDLIRITRHFFDAGKQAHRERLSWRRNPGAGGPGARPAHGLRAKVPVRSGSVRRHLFGGSGLHRRQPVQRPHLA